MYHSLLSNHDCHQSPDSLYHVLPLHCSCLCFSCGTATLCLPWLLAHAKLTDLLFIFKIPIEFQRYTQLANLNLDLVSIIAHDYVLKSHVYH